MLHSPILNDLGQKHGTDKCSGPTTHDYLRKYEFFLKPLKDQEFIFLELGVFKGGSLRTWSDYFTKATLIGVDIEEKVRDYELGRGKLIIGDLSQNDFLDSLLALSPRVVLDDASHWWPDQVRALFTLYPNLPQGGLYIMEDIHTSFAPLSRHFSVGFDTPPFLLLQKIPEYMTGNDRPCPMMPEENLVPINRLTKFNNELRHLADLTDAITFIEKSCVLIRK
ncbi:MAG: class I SAM-dependent methyltransferase [Deltaproteobacteria bacterium]|jgi:hypothetical protein|nr:class I SAM-dependent methyltransferase [Deltaproteobacteria bacterium]